MGSWGGYGTHIVNRASSDTSYSLVMIIIFRYVFLILMKKIKKIFDYNTSKIFCLRSKHFQFNYLILLAVVICKKTTI